MKTLAVDLRIASEEVLNNPRIKPVKGLLLSIVRILKPKRLKLSEIVGEIFEKTVLTIISWTR